MKISIEKLELTKLVEKQLNNFFDISKTEKNLIYKNINKVLLKTEYCFSKSKNKYFKKNKKTYFNPFNSDQYAIFLYFFSNHIYTAYKKKYENLASKFYYLNKALNGFDLLYSIKMPKVFFPYHAVGSVIGRAKFGNHFSFSQNCTVGNNKGVYPKIGNHVEMLSGSKILGNCKIGNNVLFSANSYIKDLNVPSNTIVFGQYPKNIFKKK